MKRILIVSPSNVSADPRILRQFETLKTLYETHVAGFGSGTKDMTVFYEITRNSANNSAFKRKVIKAVLLLLRAHKRLFLYEYGEATRYSSEIADASYDMILANDFDSLPLIKHYLRLETKVLLDAHEYFFDEVNFAVKNRLFKKYRQWIAKKHLDQVAGISTVSPSIAKLYEADLGVEQVTIIRNIPKRSSVTFTPHHSEQIKLIHHGAAIQGRGLEELIKLIEVLDERFVLNLMLVETDVSFLAKLKTCARPIQERVNFLPVVPTEEIVARISHFDLGIHLIPPFSMNNRYALPNKFFEFMQANLGIIIGPSPEMANIVEQYSLGVVTESFDLSDVAQSLNALHRSDIETFRISSSMASQILCWEEESKVLKHQVALIVGDDSDD